jgi:hypothetical protein
MRRKQREKLKKKWEQLWTLELQAMLCNAKEGFITHFLASIESKGPQFGAVEGNFR